MTDFELPDDVTPFQNLLIERIKKIKSPALLLTYVKKDNN